MEHCCGLITGDKVPVPLKNISVALSIEEFVADVSVALNYENEEEVPVEASFVFPMDEDSAVYSFEALVDDKKIVAELQEKTQAHSSYKNAISQGHQAYLLEEDDYSRDVFSCNIGNLLPGAKVGVTLRYVQELPLETDGALRYVLPAILNPRYQLSEQSENSCLNIQTPMVPSGDLPYTLSMVATITSQHGIERVQSNCSLSPIQYLADDKTSAQISLAEGHKFDRDLELLIYYSEVHSPSVAVEMGMQGMKPDSLMGAPSAMVSFYPDIPEVKSSKACGEFVFLMDRSGSMESPMNNQKNSQLRIEAAKETLLLLLKSLPMGCYFNIYGFGSTYEKFFPESVKYTQETMDEAVGRVKDLEADLGGTEILKPLRKIYKAHSIPGHPLQLFVFTDGEVSDTFTVINEVQLNSKKHRCFSFGIGEGASTSLIKGIARVSGGTAEFITGKDRIQTKALGSLKFALNCSMDDFSLSWDLPPGLLVTMLSPEQTVIFRGQRLIMYAQLTGTMPEVECSGEVCLKYTLQGRSLENRVAFPLQPKTNASFAIHRLAAKSLIQTKDLGSHETSKSAKEDILNISIQSGVLSSFTAFIAINKELNQPVQGPLTHRDIPRPVTYTSPCAYKVKTRHKPPVCAKVDVIPFGFICSSPSRRNVESLKEMKKSPSSTKKPNLKNDHKGFGENVFVQLVSLQKANGSWELHEDFAKILGTNLEDIMAANPAKDGDPSAWATVLAVLWLHANGKDLKCEWELLERKAVAWLHAHAGSFIPMLVQAANNILKLPVTPAVFGL
uniref:von Willebrand factor A domain-containing protein 5A n=2 Tax=Cricetulus griseus TaxID=10029 RepID=A0A8C2QM92_CRIGR